MPSMKYGAWTLWQMRCSAANRYARSRSWITTRGNVWRSKSTVRCGASILSQRCPDLPNTAHFLAISRPTTMTANSFQRRSAVGRMRMAWRLTSHALIWKRRCAKSPAHQKPRITAQECRHGMKAEADRAVGLMPDMGKVLLQGTLGFVKITHHVMGT